ncbi:MAG TPA: hypothetical protein VNU26_03580 [Mycobacteriales bacterium]|nr:hypothetical protein [Mycobacteriales bacterium]
MKRLRLTVAVLAAGALAVAGPAWSHIPAVGETVIERASATAGPGTVTVDGVVTFGGQAPVLLAEDAAGDSTGAPATTALGTDITGLAIAQRESGSEDLTFELRLADLRTPRGTPEAVQYNWDVLVDGGVGKGGTNWSIKTMGTRATTQSPQPWAGVHTCVEGGTANASFTCTETSRVEAVYDTASKTIYVNVPMSAVGAKPGSTITAWQRHSSAVWVGATAGGARTLIETFDGVAEHAPYRIPAAPHLEVGLAPAGTPVTDLRPVAVGDGGAFATTLAAAPGDHEVLVRACFAGKCASKVLPVTVTS